MIVMLAALTIALQAAPASASADQPPPKSVTPIDQAWAPPIIPRAEAVSSNSFVLSQPRLRIVNDTVRLDGLVCRRPNRSMISPTRVQIDLLSPTGELVDTSYAYLPDIRQREDQRCAHYAAKVKTLPQAGDMVRVCLVRRGGGTCQRSE